MSKCRICGEREAAYQGKCRGCANEYLREWRRLNPDKVKGYRRRWYDRKKGTLTDKWGV